MLIFGVRKGFLPRRKIDMEVSVIIPMYNKFDYLETCLRSVLDQEMDDFEVVVVDDGSTDGSGEVCDRLAAEYTRLRVIHVANGGVTRARRIAFNASSGRYVTFVDADDRMLPGGLRTLYESIERVGADEVIATYVDNSGRLCDSGMRGFVDPDVLIRQLCGSKAHFCILWAVIFRRGCVTFRPGLRSCSSGVGGALSRFGQGQDADAHVAGLHGCLGAGDGGGSCGQHVVDDEHVFAVQGIFVFQ